MVSTVVTVGCDGTPAARRNVITGCIRGDAAESLDRGRQRQRREPLGQHVVGGARRQFAGVHRRQEVLPHRVEDDLHRLGAREHRDHGVELGEHDHVLAEGTVAAVAVARHPQLEAVALLPVGLVTLGVGHLHRGGRGDPTVGKEPAAVPHAVVEVQLPESRHGIEIGVDAGESEIAARRRPRPPELADTERVENAAVAAGR